MEATQTDLPKLSQITVENSHQYLLTVYLEPWGEEHKLQPGESLVIEAFGHYEGYFEIDHQGDAIFVYGWAGSSCWVKSDDNRQLNPTVPIA